GRRGPLAGADVLGPAAFVLGGRQALQVRLAAGDRLLVDLFQEGDAPAAAGPRPAALRQLAGDLGPPQPHEVQQLAARHVEAVTHLGVEVHRRPVNRSGSSAGSAPSYPSGTPRGKAPSCGRPGPVTQPDAPPRLKSGGRNPYTASASE